MLNVLVGLLCAATWATSSILLKQLSRKLDPFTLNAPRSLIGGLAMLLLTLTTGRATAYSSLTLEKLLFLWGSVWVGGGIGDTFYLLSLPRIGVSRAFPIASSYPAFTLLFGLLFLGDQVSVALVGGMALVLAGLLVITRSKLPSDVTSTRPMQVGGILFAVICSVCWAISMILLAPGLKGLDQIMVASVRTPALSLILWGVVAARGSWRRYATLERGDWILLVAGGLVGWGLGSILFLLSVSLLGPARA
ncbi:MAG: DMT family transporter, partial [Chloroflexota bacterium]